jgi:hypothetical protein
MAAYVQCPLPGGTALIVETVEDPDVVRRASGLDRVSELASETFDSAMQRLRAAAEVVRTTMHEIDDKPHEVTVEFAVKVTAQVGVIVANSAAEANLKVTVRWTQDSDG